MKKSKVVKSKPVAKKSQPKAAVAPAKQPKTEPVKPAAKKEVVKKTGKATPPEPKKKVPAPADSGAGAGAGADSGAGAGADSDAGAGADSGAGAAAPTKTKAPEQAVRFDRRAKLKPDTKTKSSDSTSVKTKGADLSSSQAVYAPARTGAVYIDRHSDSAIVCEIRDVRGSEEKVVVYVTMQDLYVDRYKLNKTEFERTHRQLPAYPLQHALNIYRRVGGVERITERAKRAILLIDPKGDWNMATPVHGKIVGNIKGGKTDGKADGKKDGKAAGKADAKKPETTAKPKFDKSQFLSRERAAELIKKNEKAKLKANRENDKREGSLPHAQLEAILKSPTVAAALKAKFTFKKKQMEVGFGDVRSAVRRRYVEIVK